MSQKKRLGLRQVYSSMVRNVWVLDFIQEIFHDMSSGDFESTFIKATGVSMGGTILALWKETLGRVKPR